MLRKLTRGLGIALILMPEPFTTPIGIALLGISYVLPRRSGVDKRKHLRGLIKLYLNYTRPLGQAGRIVQHRLARRLTDLAGYDRVFQSRLPEKVVRHIIDIDRLVFWYGATLNTLAMIGNVDRRRMRRAEETAMQHSLVHELPPRYPGVQSRLPKEVVHHAIDSDLLLRRYGLAASSQETAVSGGGEAKATSHSFNWRKGDCSKPEQSATELQPVHHILDIPRIQARYSDTNRGLATAGYYGWVKQVEVPEKAISHALNKAKLLQEYQKTPVVPSLRPAVAAPSLY